MTDEQLAEEGLTGFRWWSPAELPESSAVFWPPEFPALLRTLLADGVPASPIAIDG
ncbi:MAG: hypothetical protein HOV78_31675 [Hamadaea sp.]|nr:hypothetical protein [Hamadaea sp.]NUT07318.1 hypothetical protein [Hamadaea sp.]